jgi:hypothetical protein
MSRVTIAISVVICIAPWRRVAAPAIEHGLLTNTVYIGRWKFNQASSKTGERKAETEVVEIPVPAIIERDAFEQVSSQLYQA